MFTVKATYRNETRRFSVNASSFPSFPQLYNQLYRIFPLSHDYYLSKLLFSPDATSPARILIGREVHSAEDYDNYIKQFRGQFFQHALLRFTVFDETPHKLPSHTKAVAWNTGPPTAGLTPMIPMSDIVRNSPPGQPLSFSHIPPPPILYSAFPNKPAPMDVDANPSSRIFGSPSFQLPQQQQQQQLPPPPLLPFNHTPTVHCCDVARAKAEVQSLLSGFKNDLDRILTNTFGTSSIHTPLFVPFVSQYSAPSSNQSDTLPVIPDFIPSTPASFMTTTQNNANACLACGLRVENLGHRCTSCDSYKCLSCNVYAKCMSSSALHTWVDSFVPSPRVITPSSSLFGSSLTQDTLFRPGYQPGYTATPGSADSIPQTWWIPPPPVVPPPPMMPSRTPTPPLVPPHPVETPRPTQVPAPACHLNVMCDMCDSTVIGIRHKCMDCPDYDLCDSCFAMGKATEHNAFHEFVDISEPGRVVVHTVYSGSGEAEATNHNVRIQHSPAPPASEPATHNAACDLCDSRIVGDRYKCINCPDFDTCSSCFSITKDQHPGHSFIKVSDPKDYMLRNSSFPQHSADCDACNTTIVGARYKCMHPDCPDFDLCQKCEAHPIPMHNAKHPMLKIRTPDITIPKLNAPSTISLDALLSSEVPTPVKITPQPSPLPPSDLSAPSLIPLVALPPSEVPTVVKEVPRPSPLPINDPTVTDLLAKLRALGTSTFLPMPLILTPPPPSKVPTAVKTTPQPLPLPLGDFTAADLLAKPTELPTKFSPMSMAPLVSQPSPKLTPPPSEVPTAVKTTPQPSPLPLSDFAAVDVLAELEALSTKFETMPSLVSQPSPKLTVNVPVDVPTQDSGIQTPLTGITNASLSSSDTLAQNVLLERIEHFLNPDDDKKEIKEHDLSQRSANRSLAALLNGTEGPAVEARLLNDDFEALLKKTQKRGESLANDFALGQARQSRPSPKYVFGSIPGYDAGGEQGEIPLSDTFQNAVTSIRSALELDKSSQGDKDRTKLPSTGTSSISLASLLNGHDGPITRDLSSPASFMSAEDEPEHVEPEIVADVIVQEGQKHVESENRVLSATFLADVTVQDGQIFPPGAEFVKSWKMSNDGNIPWPTGTEVVYVGGNMMGAEVLMNSVGEVQPGAEVEVWTRGLKAPEVPGRYVSYWKLQDDKKTQFGSNIWIDIIVEETNNESLSSSSVIVMPRAATTTASRGELTADDMTSEDGSISLVSVPASDSSGFSEYADAGSERVRDSNRKTNGTGSGALDYVVLYDDEEDSD